MTNSSAQCRYTLYTLVLSVGTRVDIRVEIYAITVLTGLAPVIYKVCVHAQDAVVHD